MNYLSHFVLAEADAGPLVAAASLLPDMLNYSSPRGQTHVVPKSPCNSALWPWVCEGIVHHLDVDREFHNGDWFEQRMKASSEWCKAVNSPLAEHWGLGLARHVVIELAIDRELLLRDDELPNRVYQGLETLAGDAAVLKALEAQYTEPEGLRNYLTRFLTLRFLASYATPASFVHVLRRVFTLLLERKPRLRELNPDATAFTAAEEAALPEMIDFIVADVRRSGLPPICVRRTVVV